MRPSSAPRSAGAAPRPRSTCSSCCSRKVRARGAMYDRPEIVELVAAVREFVERRALPALEGHTAFHARVVANALAIVERQLRLGAESEATELHRLRALRGRGGNVEARKRRVRGRS